MPVVTDSFTGTGGLSANWAGIPGSPTAQAFSRVSDKCAFTGTRSQDVRWVANTFSGDQYAQATISALPASDWSHGPKIKSDGYRGTGYRASWTSSRIIVQRNDSTIIIDVTSLTLAVGDIIKITSEASGANQLVKLWRNGVQLGSTFTDTTPPTGTYIGIASYYESATASIDDFEGGDLVGAGTPPSITTQPSNASVTAGATATFTAAASGSPAPTYQWQRNPGGVGSWADIASATSASYTTPATTVSGGTANNGDTYRVVATNASGSATSTAATLTVSASNAAPTFPGPSISNLSITQGAAMTAVNVAGLFSDTDALTFSAVGTWPAGVTVSSAGVISGTPTVVGNYTGLTVRATDTAAQTVNSNSFSITVTAVMATLNFQAAGMEFGARTGLGISTFALDVGSGYRYTVHADGLTLGAALYTSGVVTTDSGGKLPNLVDASITAGVTYRVHAVRQSDGAAATFKMVAA